jgi:hypothetical protein
MYRVTRSFSSLTRAFTQPNATRRRLAGAAGLGLASGILLWTAPTTLLDDYDRSRRVSALRTGTYATEHLSKSEDMADSTETLRKTSLNADQDPDGARAATFAQAETFLKHGILKTEALGTLPLDEHMMAIFNSMGVTPEDTRLWTISNEISSDDTINGVYLAVSAKPDVMENHMMATAALQFELDKWRKEGRLLEDTVLAIIQYRDVLVELEYKSDGRFTPVLRHPLTGKRIPFGPLERFIVRTQADGTPLLLHEGNEYAIDVLQMAEED